MDRDSRVEPIDLNALRPNPRHGEHTRPANKARRTAAHSARHMSHGRHKAAEKARYAPRAEERPTAPRRMVREDSPPRQRMTEPELYDFNFMKKDAQRRARIRRNRLLLLGAILAIIVAVIGIRLAVTVGAGLNTFYEGISVDGLKLHGYTRQEAIDNLVELNRRRLQEMTVTLRYGEQEWTISPDQLGATLDIEEQVDAAWILGREGNVFKRQAEIGKLKRELYAASTTITYDETQLEQWLSSIKDSIDMPAKDATMDFDTSREEMFRIVPEQEGRMVVLEDLLLQVKSHLSGGLGEMIDVRTIPIEPKIFSDDLRNSTNRIKRVTTPLGNSSQARIENIKLALSMFDGMIVMPGEEVSFNKTTGPRELENGYKIATVIQDDEFVDGPGGGVCQVSTTLYQALVLSGVDIVRRNMHSLPVSYVELGTDAAVSYDSKDLIFKNNTGSPLYLECRVASGASVSVTVYGRALEEGVEIKFITELLETIPAPAPEILTDKTGEYGIKYADETFEKKQSREGYKVRTYAATYKNGEEISRVQLTNDYYREVQGVTYIGASQRPATVPTVTENEAAQ